MASLREALRGRGKGQGSGRACGEDVRRRCATACELTVEALASGCVQNLPCGLMLLLHSATVADLLPADVPALSRGESHHKTRLRKERPVAPFGIERSAAPQPLLPPEPPRCNCNVVVYRFGGPVTSSFFFFAFPLVAPTLVPVASSPRRDATYTVSVKLPLSRWS